MFHDLATCFTALSFMVAAAFILWGLQIYKVIVILIGMALGFFLGNLIGLRIERTQEAALVGGFLGMIVSGLLAWPLQKVYVAFLAGIAGALIAATIAAGLDIPLDGIKTLAVIGFLVSCVLSFLIFEYVVVAFMALSAAGTIFRFSERPAFPKPRISFGFDLEEYMHSILDAFAARFWMWFVTIVICVGFALLFQKFWAPRESDDDSARIFKQTFRRTTYLLVGFALVGLFFHNIRLGFGTITWATCSIAVSYALLHLNRALKAGRWKMPPATAQFLTLALIALLLNPLVAWLTLLVIRVEWMPPSLIFVYPLLFKSIRYDTSVGLWILAQAAFHFGVFPLLFRWAWPHEEEQSALPEKPLP